MKYRNEMEKIVENGNLPEKYRITAKKFLGEQHG